MKLIQKIIAVLATVALVSVPVIASAVTPVLTATSTTQGWSWVAPINSLYQALLAPYFIATSTTASSTFANGINLTGGCYAILGTCLSPASGGGVSSVTATWPSLSSGGTTPNITWGGLASSTNLVSSNLFYSTGVNTFGQVATSSETCSAPISCTAFNVVGSSGAISFSNLTVPNGGTGATAFGQGWLFSNGGTGALSASTSPTVNYITATSTTATSTFANGINLTGGCLKVNGSCLTSGGGGGSGTVGSGTTGQFPYYASNGTTLTATSTLFVSSAAYVGIHQTSPEANLEIDNVNTTDVPLNVTAVNTGQSADLTDWWLGRNTYPVASVDNTGRISAAYATIIPEPNPNAPSAINGYGQETLGSINTDPNGYSILRFRNDTSSGFNGTAGEFFNGSTRSSDGGGDAFSFFNDVGQFRFRAAGNGVIFATGVFPGTDRMVIDASTTDGGLGNVGIGTSSPWRNLSVYGSSDLGINALAGTFTATSTTASSTFANGMNITAGCYAIRNTCLTQNAGTVTSVGLSVPSYFTVSGSPVMTSGTLAVSQISTFPVSAGGTGNTTFGQGWLYSTGGTSVLAASTSPTVNYITATSTIATSTFANGINLTGGCFQLNGSCLSSGGGGSGTVNSGTTGQFPYYASSGTALTATSSIFVSTKSLIGVGGTTTPVAIVDSYTAATTTANLLLEAASGKGGCLLMQDAHSGAPTYTEVYSESGALYTKVAPSPLGGC